MKNLVIIISIVLVGVLVSAGALVVGYQLGSVIQVKRNTLSLPPESNQAPVESDQSKVEISGDTLVLYSQNCASCHGARGGGSALAPALNHPDLRTRLGEAEIRATIEQGRPGTAMPAWKNRLTDSQIDSLTSLIHNWDKLDAEQLSELESQAQYRHGMGGWQENSPMPGAGCSAGMGGRGRRSP